MENEEKKNEINEDYIEKINELKAKSVPKEDYDRLREDNKRLLDSIVNGQKAADDDRKKGEEEKIDIQALRDELYGGRYEGTDLDYITKVLKLRKGVMDAGYPDPGVCNGVKTVATEADYENCEALCDTLQEVVDAADGDPGVFRAELMRRMK